MPVLVRLLGLLLGLLLTTLLGVGLAAGVAAPAQAAPGSDVDVVAHRGSSGAAPENTLAAVRLAVQQRSDVVENDIQRTRDGELVILHDTSLARTTDVEERFPDRAPWNVADFTLAEIRTLDAGSWFAPEFAGARVPTLAEWGDAVGRRTGMLLEVKNPSLYPGIAADLDRQLDALPVFRAALRADRLVVQSFDHAWLRTYDQVAGNVPVGLLFAGGPPTEAQLADAATWAEQANPALGDMTEATVDQIHSHGLETHVWTVNDGQGMRRAIGWDVDGVITNYPQVLRDILRRG
ncbi:glycerophosphodiester phosphodiesterase [Nocardioides euryhalodurans]|uniref:Glycerophosphodiester phosphodiesterase n=1 Tax=Nocardioides euryhalodurans TaxID=2518370 RepID=A0A4P7GP78_9ACTN|nr:glycerophosphodiester phosphodiesterase family protein [Nocardioides euryhalodurans]QBR93920.1 glycerophosphodiester phosphodiesterase [Nocardioides euryhalodurans]